MSSEAKSNTNSASSFKWVKLVSPIEKHLIFGYVREVQKRLLPSAINCNIPMLIFYMVLKYHYLGKQFITYQKQVTLNESKNEATFTNNTQFFEKYAYLYSNKAIDHTLDLLYRYKIKIIEMSDCIYSVGIGISSGNKSARSAAYFTYWSQGVEETYIDDGTRWGQYNADSKYGEKFGIGDIITMEVDTRNKTIKFYKNDKDLGFVPVHSGSKVDFTKDYYLQITLTDYGKVQLWP